MQAVVRKAIFPVGGLGTRFLPVTKAMPKEMLPVVDKPLIQYAVEEARAAGIEQLIFVTGRGKQAIEDHFDQSLELADSLAARGKQAELAALESILAAPGEVAYIRQQEGTARPGPRGLVRPAPGGRGALRGAAGRRPDPVEDPLPRADAGGSPGGGRQHGGSDGRAA
jgi:hypothetical protein